MVAGWWVDPGTLPERRRPASLETHMGAALETSTAGNDRPDAGLPEAPPGRWDGVVRDYRMADVERLRPSIRIEHTLASVGARRLWELLTTRDYVAALGALTGGQ